MIKIRLGWVVGVPELRKRRSLQEALVVLLILAFIFLSYEAGIFQLLEKDF